MPGPTFFITGATGPQGNAVTRHLLSKGCTVHAITRNPNSSTAVDLSSLGVKLFTGELDNEEVLRSGMKGCTGIFLNVPPSPLTAVDYCKHILAAAKDTGTIIHVVCSTSFSTDHPERLAAWDPNGAIAMILRPKQIIEELVRNGGFEYWTILRPGNFMANFLKPKILLAYRGLEMSGIFRTSFQKENIIPMVDHDDIGKFGAAALLDPARFHTQAIHIASELLTVDEIMSGLSKATGKKITAYFLSDEEFEVEAANNSPASWQKVLRDMVQFADMEKLNAWKIPLNSFSEFLEREKEIVEDTYSQVPY
ncbi:hypothetical protein UA08_09383 [Talaromyces atroroseus]|uniref:NmrA-like domain-containing protein n=1 Tax=Talaromyces atroroseus TaxID=1441469 RepID=A0A1Q5Q6B8_TALAT|nr:hypothetical protein UA08_09383 [Talaromyces atroroseus]OKL55374.1 hypothetical protein UA08_09383 [Talaromyces atroroseus]